MKTTPNDCPWLVGIARQKITPPLNVELAGLGYYLNRTAHRVRDDLTATAFVVQSKESGCAAIVALDIMYASDELTHKIRQQVAAQIEIPECAVCVNCSHSHNAPTAAYVCGVGEVSADYVDLVAQKAIAAIVQAWKQREPATLRVGAGEVENLTFNRTRENGPVDTRLSVLSAANVDGIPFAVIFNFHSHLTAHLEIDFRAISRDWPGEVIDQVEAELPGSIVMFLQGTCGDVMLKPEFNSTARRFEPASAISNILMDAMKNARFVSGRTVDVAVNIVRLPTRRWTHEEIDNDRKEGLYRLETGDTQGWLNGFARVIVCYPDRLPIRYDGDVDKTVKAVSRFAVEWTGRILPVLETRPEHIDTEVQAIRIGNVLFAAHSAELFSTLGLKIREKAPTSNLFMLGYSNGALSYLPDAYDVRRKSYAANQSPKFIGHFPFTDESGNIMVKGVLEALRQVDKLEVSDHGASD
jgi:hypothetical protein